MVNFPVVIDADTPVRYHERERAADAIPEYLTAAEMDAIIDRAKNPKQRLAMLTMWRAAVRVSELLGLYVEDLRLHELDARGEARPGLVIRAGKRSRDRVVPMHRELRNAYRIFLPSGARGKIWGESRVTVYRWVRRAALLAAQDGHLPEDRARRVSPHTLRHSAAHHWLGSGIELDRIRQWLGHSDIGVTMIYLRTSPDPTGDMERVP